MSRKIAIVLAICMLATMHVSTAFAMEVLPKDEKSSEKVIPKEPLILPDPNEVVLEENHGKESSYIKNGKHEDSGNVELFWNGSAYATYGCSTATINYGNPKRSNIDMTLDVAIFDGDLIEYFGTTFRPKKEVNELALKGFEALQKGINLSDAAKLVDLNYFGEMTPEEVIKLNKEELASILGEQNFADLTEDELLNLNEESVKELSEVNKLTLAQLGGYGFYTYYIEIGNTGLIEKGYAIYQVDLYTLPGSITLPKGKYKAVFVLNAYDKLKNEFSDFFIHLPISLEIKEDLPKELQEEYNVTLATRIDVQ